MNDPQINKWFNKIVGKEGEDFSRHDKWLCMMHPRLKLLQKLLSSDGAVFISIDDNELYNLKLVCDEIFGHNCFVGDISWQLPQRIRREGQDGARQALGQHRRLPDNLERNLRCAVFAKRPLLSAVVQIRMKSLSLSLSSPTSSSMRPSCCF